MTDKPDRVWPLMLVFTEDERTTRADVVLDVAGRHYHGWGRSRRSLADPDIPRVGEEIAAARALTGLAQQLVGAAEDDIEGFEHKPVHVHA